LKQGRWPFRHKGCPAADRPSGATEGGLVWRNPNLDKEDMDAMVSNTWDGIQCPNCRRIYFPIQLSDNSDGTRLISNRAQFFYGGDHKVGDLKIELKINVEKFGSMRVECGNTLRRAIWNIPTRNDADGQDKEGKTHFVQKQTAALSPGMHTITLMYVDGTVIAKLDNNEIEKRLLDVEPVALNAAMNAESIARISFTGVKGKIEALNLYRDLFYTGMLSGGQSPSDRAREQGHRYDENGNLVMKVPDGEYLMMGDNSPSSSDGRVWGFVPRERLMGRAWVVGWPLSRKKVIK